MESSGQARDTEQAMSEENVEIVRRSYDAYGRGDLEAALVDLDPEIEIYDHDIPESSEYRGLEGLFRWQADWESSWESWRWEPEEFIEAGERVVAVLRVHAKGRQSGADVERVDGAVWTLREGKCVRLDYFGSRDQALEAAGLSE
jgi:ketosteroid isomerase-like protein